jgi:hypothetical protein
MKRRTGTPVEDAIRQRKRCPAPPDDPNDHDRAVDVSEDAKNTASK